MQEKKGYSLYSNFKYIFQELKRFSMSSVLISFMKVPSKVIVALITVYTPKIVLDVIQKPATIKEFILMIIAVTIFLAFMFIFGTLCA